MFISKTDCEYVFQWDTYLVCSETPDDECGYHDNTGDFYDFKQLQQNTPVEVGFILLSPVSILQAASV